MTQEIDLFNDSNNPDPQEPDSSVYLEYVQQKYGIEAPEPLAKAMWHKDRHIEQLHSEQAGLRQELNTRVKMEEFLDRMNSSSSQNAPNNVQLPEGQNGTNQAKPLTAEDVSRLWDERERTSKEINNLKQVQDTLITQLGPNYASKVKETVNTLGIPEEEALALAKRSPSAFIRLLGLDQDKREPFTTPPKSQFNTTAFKSNSRQKFDHYSDYEALRKSDPNTFWTPKIQNEIMEKHERLGAAFGLHQ